MSRLEAYPVHSLVVVVEMAFVSALMLVQAAILREIRTCKAQSTFLSRLFLSVRELFAVIVTWVLCTATSSEVRSRCAASPEVSSATTIFL